MLVTGHCYLRPSEILDPHRNSLLPPGPNFSWSIVLLPQQEWTRNKTGATNDTAILSSRRHPGLPPALQQLEKGDPDEGCSA